MKKIVGLSLSLLLGITILSQLSYSVSAETLEETTDIPNDEENVEVGVEANESIVDDVRTTDIIINEENFPEEEIREIAKTGSILVGTNEFEFIDKDQNGVLSLAERSRVTNFRRYLTKSGTMDYTYISNSKTLKGIEHFPNLSDIRVSRGKQTEVQTPLTLMEADLSQNLALETVIIDNGDFTSIDVSMLSNLSYLSLEAIPLTALDVTNNANLSYLTLKTIPLIALDVTNNAELEVLRVDGGNKLETAKIDLTKNLKLRILNLKAKDGEIGDALDVSANIELGALSLSGYKFETVDLSKNINLSSLIIRSSNLITLDLSNNPKLMDPLVTPETKVILEPITRDNIKVTYNEVTGKYESEAFNRSFLNPVIGLNKNALGSIRQQDALK